MLANQILSMNPEIIGQVNLPHTMEKAKELVNRTVGGQSDDDQFTSGISFHAKKLRSRF
jgi:hypothetical protein